MEQLETRVVVDHALTQALTDQSTLSPNRAAPSDTNPIYESESMGAAEVRQDPPSIVTQILVTETPMPQRPRITSPVLVA